MARVITFSRKFQKAHPRAGEPTGFAEKIMVGLSDLDENYVIPDDFTDWSWDAFYSCQTPKIHTIRGGQRFKVGDTFSPRVWSDKPYASKQIQIGPDTEVKQIWEFCYDGNWFLLDKMVLSEAQLMTVAANDGLSLNDFMAWFSKPFHGQIICWSDEISYP